MGCCGSFVFLPHPHPDLGPLPPPPHPAQPSQSCLFVASYTGRDGGGQRPNAAEGQTQPGQMDSMSALPFGLATLVPGRLINEAFGEGTEQGWKWGLRSGL